MLALSDDELVVLGAASAERFLRAGVTTIFDCGARGDTGFRIRDAVNRGLVLGPRTLVSGRPITRTGGHCWWWGGEADGVDDVRAAVDQAPRRGGRRRHQDDGHRRLHDHDDEPLGVGLSARGVRGRRRGGPQARALHHRACPRRRRHAARVRGRHRLPPARLDDRPRPELAVLRGGRPGHGGARHTSRDDDGPGHPRRPREGRGRRLAGGAARRSADAGDVDGRRPRARAMPAWTS